MEVCLMFYMLFNGCGALLFSISTYCLLLCAMAVMDIIIVHGYYSTQYSSDTDRYCVEHCMLCVCVHSA